jgi:hypothetical protein
MNVLILTPDRVGSSLLQKYITVTMQHYDYQRPVINLHELTNGIESYHSAKYNQQVLGKPEKSSWGYHQTLEEITRLLGSVEHYKVSRLAQYHILNRQDSLKDQLSFYQYINDNFFIISARRQNLFEHALSWCIAAFSKHLNVYDHQEKISVFKDLYQKKITIDQEVFKNYLDKYVNYLSWVDNHFTINSIFNYEKDVADLETYVANLDIYPVDHKPVSWQDQYGISWKDWNTCHYLISDMSGFSASLPHDQKLLLENSNSVQRPLLSMNLNQLMTRPGLSLSHQEFLTTNSTNYVNAYKTIYELVHDRTLIAGIPIKLQTLAEKALLVKNFKECLDTYNEWSNKSSIGKILSIEKLGNNALTELETWYNHNK